jgi:hypothetical protein
MITLLTFKLGFSAFEFLGIIEIHLRAPQKGDDRKSLFAICTESVALLETAGQGIFQCPPKLFLLLAV